MRPSDFLKTDAQTPLCESFSAGGVACEIWTNSDSILEAVRGCFLPAENPEAPAEFRMRFWVDSGGSGRPPWPKPYIRGLDHLVFAGFDSSSSTLINLRSRQAIGRFSRCMAEDVRYWKDVIFPMIFSIAGGSLGMAEIHAACVVQDQRGLLLSGPSGSGKSTLSVALGQRGFGFLSDDRTLCSLRAGRLHAWGLPRPLKLRLDAGGWFQALRGEQPTDVQKGEPVFRCEPDRQLDLKPVRECGPRMLVFLEQQKTSGFSLSPMPRAGASRRLERDLMMELPDASEKQARILDALAELPCWQLQYGGAPDVIAEKLSGFFCDAGIA